jgi:hypothetical protein
LRGSDGWRTATLDEAQAAAEELSVAVGARERAPEVAAQAVRDRQVAFTLFMNSYDEICAAVGFVRRKQGDADTIAPSLYVGRSSKKKPAETTEAKPPTPATPTTTATPTQPSTATTSPTQPARKADVSDDGPYLHQ